LSGCWGFLGQVTPAAAAGYLLSFRILVTMQAEAIFV